MSDRLLDGPAGQATGKRKEEHLRIALHNDVAFKQVSTGFEDYYFLHNALPEVDLDKVDTSASLLGRELSAPLVISPMVGGIEEVRGINRNMAEAAQILGLAMGVGSQRCFIGDPDTLATYQVRDIAPDILLFANLGAVQLNCGYGLRECRLAVETIGADALVLHLNPVQEALQPEGNTNFSGLLARIERVCAGLPVPVIVKEVGCGISEEVARKLAAIGVAAIDVAGAGGTSWTKIEGYRARRRVTGNVAVAFASWGIPTADSVIMARRGAPHLPVIASGGIRTGLDVAKAIALGADAAGIAAPLLKAAGASAGAVVTLLEEVIRGFRISMFGIGAVSLKELKFSPALQKRKKE